MPAVLTDTIAEWESKELSNEKISFLLYQIIVCFQNLCGWVTQE